MSLLNQELSSVGSRFRRLEWWRGVSVVCILLAVTGVALLVMQITAEWMHPYSGWVLLIGGLFCLAVVGLTTWRKYQDPRWVARQIEDRFPELDQRLITSTLR